MRDFNEYKRRKIQEYGSRFDDSDLVNWAIPFFESGKRIKVLVYGKELTGTIGVTTGWKPCFLLMRKRNSISSGYLINANVKLLAIQNNKSYDKI